MASTDMGTEGADLSVSVLHKLLTSVCPPSRPGAIHTKIFISKELSIIAPENSQDEVYPGIYLGDQHFAKDKGLLEKLGITHLINCAEGSSFHQVNTSQECYSELGITYKGVRAMDTASFKLHEHFIQCADFISDALESQGRVGVHCVHGMSRSAAIVLSYLMIKQNMHLEDAICTVRTKRAIFPNNGFLRQLIELDAKHFKR